VVDLSLHLLDLLQNSAHAGARNVEVLIVENLEQDLLEVTVSDDGKGITSDEIERVLDPFYTTSTKKKVGLGLPLVAQAAMMAGGSLHIDKSDMNGTRVVVKYRLNHPDRQPLGDIVATLVSFSAGNPEVRVVFTYRGPQGEYSLDTNSIWDDISEYGRNQIMFLSKFEEELTEGLNSAGYRPDRGGFVFEID